jgi:hypothetical protein
MAADDEDWVLRFLREFASMSEEERDAAIDALPPEVREGLLALAEAREATAGADLVEVLHAGHGGLDKLYELTQPRRPVRGDQPRRSEVPEYRRRGSVRRCGPASGMG